MTAIGMFLMILGIVCGWITEQRARRFEPDIRHASEKYANQLYRSNELEKFFWKSSIKMLVLIFEKPPEEVNDLVVEMKKFEVTGLALIFVAIALLLLGGR